MRFRETTMFRVTVFAVAAILAGCGERQLVTAPQAAAHAAPGSAARSLVSAPTSPKIRAGVDQVCELYPAANTVQCQKMWNYGNGTYGGADFGQYVASYTDPRIVDLVTGPYSMCVLLNTGNTKCWGEDASAIEYTGGDAVSVSLSRGSACVVTAAGTVLCRSASAYNGIYASTLDTWTVEYAPTGVDPTKANPVPYTGKAQWIVSGGQFHCFQTDANPDPSTLSCLGSSYGNSSAGAFDQNDYPRYKFNGTPLPVSSSSSYNICVLMQEGNVDCLPIYYNDNGYVSGPKNAPGVGATDLSGQGATCALIPGGDIECWGSSFNFTGLVGNATPYFVRGRNAVAIGKPGADLCWLDAVASVRCLSTKGGAVLGTAPAATAVSTTTSVSFGPGPFVYTGSAFTATASVSPASAGNATISYQGDCTNAGTTCQAMATFAGTAGYASSTSGWVSITIAKAPTSTTAAFSAGSFVYTGAAVTATASVSPSAAGSATIAYSGDCVNVGNTCAASATFAGNDNYLPSGGNAGPVTITQAPTTTTVSFGQGPFVYTGSVFAATAAVSPLAGTAYITYAGQCKFAGTCIATATFPGSPDYAPSTATASITITYPVVQTADQCKDGGWQYLTDDLGNLFKNQGDCVSYVATKGKNKGSGGT